VGEVTVEVLFPSLGEPRAVEHRAELVTLRMPMFAEPIEQVSESMLIVLACR
jgi:hypothetical protein